jgi:hypothetical protein
MNKEEIIRQIKTFIQLYKDTQYETEFASLLKYANTLCFNILKFLENEEVKE